MKTKDWYVVENGHTFSIRDRTMQNTNRPYAGQDVNIANVAVTRSTGSQASENAYLIAAAPLLLKALEEIVPPVPVADAQCHIGICEQDQCYNCRKIIAAHNAIKLAKKGTIV